MTRTADTARCDTAAAASRANLVAPLLAADRGRARPVGADALPAHPVLALSRWRPPGEFATRGPGRSLLPTESPRPSPATPRGAGRENKAAAATRGGVCGGF